MEQSAEIQEHSNEPPEGGAIDACANVTLGGGTLVRLDAEGAGRTEDGHHRRFEPRRRGPLTAEIDGFNLQPRCASRPRMMRGSARRHVHRFADPDGRLDYSRSIRLMQSLSPALRFGSVATPGRSTPRATIA